MERFYHFRVKKDGVPLSRGGVTFIIRELESEGEKNKYGYNFAVCSLKDNYNKKKGRLIAKGRLDKDPEKFILFLKEDEDLYSRVWKTVSFIRANHLKELPRWDTLDIIR